jgi:hypothetical protein
MAMNKKGIRLPNEGLANKESLTLQRPNQKTNETILKKYDYMYQNINQLKHLKFISIKIIVLAFQ